MKEYQSRQDQSFQPPAAQRSNPFQPRPFAPIPEAQTPADQAPAAPGSIFNKPSFLTFSIQDPTGTSRQPIQPKLTIGAPGDRYEQEADRMATQVVQQINAPQANHPQSVQRMDVPEEDELQMKPLAEPIQRVERPEEEELQMKPDGLQREIAPEEEDELQMKPMLQMKSEGAVAASDDLESAIQQSRGSGQPLTDSIREPMEQAFGGVDFRGVKVHVDGRSDQLNRSIQAKAFTTGQDVYFRQGAYQPESRAGQELLAHELTHVVQQSHTTVRRMVAYNGTEVDGKWLLNRLKTKDKSLYADAKKLMTDADLVNFFQPYISDTDQFFVSQVFDALKAQVDQQNAQGAFNPSLTEKGVKVELKETKHNLPSQLNIDQTANSIDLHPAANLLFQGQLAAQVPDDQLNQWTLGMTQTLFSAHRRLRMISSRGARTVEVDVANPCVDHRSASNPPWYDVKDTWVLDQNFGLGKVYLDDRPGYTIPKVPGAFLFDSQGQDVFKTWVILRDRAGTTTRYLYEWAWNLTYQPGGGAVQAGAPTDQTTGQGAVLGGTRASDTKTVTDDASLTWNLPSMAGYKTMKDEGKAMLTPFSGMMPVDEYEALRMKFVACIDQGNLTQAMTTLTQIKLNLDRMDQAKHYWKDSATKAQKFQPFYNQVNQALINLQTFINTP